MAPRQTPERSGGRSTARDEARAKARDAQLKLAISRLRETDQRLTRLENTVKGLARELGGVSVGGPCAECSDCLVIVKRERIYCPQCGHSRTM